MKAVVVLALCLVACTKAAPPAKPPPIALASADQCNQIYSRCISIQIAELGVETSSELEFQTAAKLLDNEMRESGASERFFNSCMSSTNVDQAACMMGAISFKEMHRCALVFASK